MSKNKLNIYKEPIFALLKQNKTSSDGLPITHLSFGLFNGKFHLNADDRDKFMELYINAINNGVDDLTILGGFKDKIHVKGNWTEYDETKIPKLEVGVSYLGSDFPKTINGECILSINRKMFKKMLDAWLDEKIDYCDRWNHYCGVGGDIYCKVEEAYNTFINEYLEVEDNGENDGIKEIKKDIIVYDVKSFDEIDMEHG